MVDYIYYGAADKRIAAASVDLEELIPELQFKAATINEITKLLSSLKMWITTYSQDQLNRLKINIMIVLQ
jgi:hypothetical protein